MTRAWNARADLSPVLFTIKRRAPRAVTRHTTWFPFPPTVYRHRSCFVVFPFLFHCLWVLVLLLDLLVDSVCINCLFSFFTDALLPLYWYTVSPRIYQTLCRFHSSKYCMLEIFLKYCINDFLNWRKLNTRFEIILTYTTKTVYIFREMLFHNIL